MDITPIESKNDTECSSRNHNANCVRDLCSPLLSSASQKYVLPGTGLELNKLYLAVIRMIFLIYY